MVSSSLVQHVLQHFNILDSNFGFHYFLGLPQFGVHE